MCSSDLTDATVPELEPYGELPERYAVADPVALVPTGAPTTCVHGEHDEDVPLSQSQTYVAAAGSGARLVRFDGGHDEHLDPGSEACAAMRAALVGA